MVRLNFFRVVIVAAVVAVSLGAARAKDVTVTFSDEEQKALWAIFDAASKADGMKVAGNVAFLWQKVVQAAEKQNGVEKPKDAPTK